MNINEYQQLLEDKVHTDASFPYNTYLCTIPLDFSCVPIHWHDEIELIIIKKGQGFVHVDLVEYPVYAGDIVFVLPGKLHSIEEAVGHHMEYENILFRKELLLAPNDDLCANAFLMPLFRETIHTDCYIHSSLSYYEEIRDVIRSIDQICSSRPTGYQLAVKSRLFQLFFIIISNLNKNTSHHSETKKLDKIKIVVKYVAEHYNEPITLSQMAKLCYYSDSHFMKFFKLQMKESFISYLNNYRLTIAARMLTSTPLSILEIANHVGFNNLSYFNRLFKKRYGITPKQMR
ncbi:MAG: AraC family transcriptional regulator [Hespellia sp.]|nr:AraC family transcriptional regulator [Hespellia sp.]